MYYSICSDSHAQVTGLPKRTQDITSALESSHMPFPNQSLSPIPGIQF